MGYLVKHRWHFLLSCSVQGLEVRIPTLDTALSYVENVTV